MNPRRSSRSQRWRKTNVSSMNSANSVLISFAWFERSLGQIAEHHVDDMLASSGDALPRSQFAVEQPRQRMLVGQEEVGQSRDRQIQIDRIDASAEDAFV